MDDDQFRQLLDWFDFSWSGYRKVRKGVKKRISRHMQELKCPNVNAYLDLLNKSAELRQECEKRMAVSISRFFRDRQLWHDLEANVLPRMIEKEKKALRVWSAGCARGEEVYSFKIVWERLNKAYEQLPEIAITATDMHPDYLDKARAGVYAKSSMKEVPQKVRERYFNIRKGGNLFELKAAFKKGIEWKVQDIFSDPPGPAFDIIFLRNNLLTYYKAPCAWWMADCGIPRKTAFSGYKYATTRFDTVGLSARCLEMISKPHLRPNGCVVPRIEMLTYYVYAPLPMRGTP
jgi:chemotaxis methyl-accepting protein methylase